MNTKYGNILFNYRKGEKVLIDGIDRKRLPMPKTIELPISNSLPEPQIINGIRTWKFGVKNEQS
jgi:hypothetical protein